MLVLPAWAVAVLVTLTIAIIGFAWRLAERASISAEKLDAATTRLVALEARIATIAQIEAAVAVLAAKVEDLREKMRKVQ